MHAHLPAYPELTRRAEFFASIEGPNSGGGTSVLVAGDVLYVVVYGDVSTLPSGAEQVVSALSFDEAAQRFGRHANWPEIAAHFARRAASPQTVLAVLGPTAWRHSHSLTALAGSPDGALVAGGGESLSLWRSADGALVRQFEWPSGRSVDWLAFSVDGSLLAVAHAGALDVWTVRDGKRRVRNARSVHCIVPRADGGFVIVWERDGVSWMSRFAANLVETEMATLGRGVATAVVSPDASWLALSSDAAPGEVTLYSLVPSLAIARVWRGPRTFVYETDSRDFWGEPQTERHESPALIRALAFDPSSTRLFTAGREPIARCFAFDRDEPLAEVSLGDRNVVRLVPHPSRLCVAVGHERGDNSASKLWDLDKHNRLTRLRGSGPALAFAADGSHLFVGSPAHRVVLHDADGAPIPTDDPGDAPFALVSTPDASTVVTASRLALRAFATSDGALRWMLARVDQWEHPLGCTPDGAELVMTTSTTAGAVAPMLERMRLGDHAMLEALGAAARHPRAVAVSPDGAIVASIGHDDDVQLRDARVPSDAPRAILRVAAPYAVRFLPDGRGLLVVQKSGDLALFRWEQDPDGNFEATSVLSRVSPASSDAANFFAPALAVSRDGRRALSGFNDVVYTWDLASGVETGASEPSTQLARVLSVGFDRHDVVRAVLALPTTDIERGEGTSIQLWTAGDTAEIAWSPSESYRFEARALFLDDGARFVLVHDDGVPRVHPLPPARSTLG